MLLLTTRLTPYIYFSFLFKKKIGQIFGFTLAFFNMNPSTAAVSQGDSFLSVCMCCQAQQQGASRVSQDSRMFFL